MHISNIGDIPNNGAIGAHLGDVKELYNLARDSNPEARAELSNIIGSILEAELKPRESELVADVLIKLMRQAEKDLRLSISKQISILDNVPLRLVLQLANDEIDIARPILTKSSVLGGLDLMYIIKSKSSEYWQAIAAREELDRKVVNILADTNDFETALVLVQNENIKLTQHALIALSDIAQGSDILATPLLHRDEVTSEIVSQLYEYVGAELKCFISDHYGIDDNSIAKVSSLVDAEVQEFSAGVTPKGFLPDDHMIIAAKSFKDKDLLDIKLMLCTLRRGHVRSFIAQLSVYTDLPVETVADMLSRSNGQGLAIAAKAYGISKHDFISIFMLTSKIWNNGMLVGVNEIQTAIEYFNKATPEIAKKIIEGNM